MAILKEWSCLTCGPFEASHPVCPEFGCDSAHVTREFRTAPTIGSRMVKQFDAGMKRSSDMMGISNFRSARAGEAAYGGDKGRELGMPNGVLWGDQCRKVMGRSFAELTGMAHKPLIVNKRDGSGQLRLDRNNAMAEAATDLGITRRRLPVPGELAVAKADKVPQEKVTALTT